MNDSFSNSNSTTFLGAAKVPPPAGEPNDNWTVEELVRWSLEQYRSKVIEQTSSSIASLRDQCEKECEDVIKLHEAAVETKLSAKSNSTKRGGENAVTANASTGASSTTTRRTEEENMNPQVENAQRCATTKTLATMTAESLIDDNAGTSTISSSSNTNITASTTDPIATGTIEITITSGPHASTTYTLLPTMSAPCLVGRSKGKKFIKNGISLFKDQEVSTTHGKFVVEEMDNQNTKNGNNGSSSSSSSSSPLLLFYFVDVGSTNGTLHNGVALEPHQRLLLESGMELKVGNSVLKILLG